MKNSGVDDRYLLAPCSELAQAYEDNRLIDDAIEQWNEVYARALNTKNQFAVINCNKALMGLYAKKGDMKNFLIAKDKYFTYSDSFMNQRSFLQVKNDWKHIEQPTSKTSKKNNYFWLWICVVAFMITPLWVIYNKKSERKKIKKSTVRKITERSSAQKDDMRQAILQIFNDKETICNPDFTLNTMATLLHSNTSYVSAYINDNFNKNFRTLLNQYRIEYGKRILADETTYGNITIQAIAQMLGYKSATTFVSAFKTLTGMTPSTWKKQQSDNNLS